LIEPLVSADSVCLGAITALIQELTPEGDFLQSNHLPPGGRAGGWLIAGGLVGFMYNISLVACC